jgi:hypothetical protein
MKALLFSALLALPLVAQAQPYTPVGDITLPNQGGGLIHLSFQHPPQCGSDFYVWSPVTGGQTYTGCWNFMYDGVTVFVKWTDGSFSTFATRDLTFPPELHTPTK